MTMTKFSALLGQYEKALKRLKDALQQPEDEFMRDSAIQRFEFTFDLSWKLVKTYLESKEGVVCASPKKCFREAYKQQLIDYEPFWLDLADARNQTVHSYNEDIAKEIYALLPKAVEYFEKLFQKINSAQ